MYQRSPTVPRTVLDVPGFPATITVYGKASATRFEETISQGYFVSLEGTPTARSELTPALRGAVQQLLTDKFPQHARI